jgi:hypothetical protein
VCVCARVCVCVCGCGWVDGCVALVIQHVKRVRRIIFSSVASTAVPDFFVLFHK